MNVAGIDVGQNRYLTAAKRTENPAIQEYPSRSCDLRNRLRAHVSRVA